MAGATSGKQWNQERIIHLLREERTLTKQDIARRLKLSMPTALQNINELLEYGILEECGSLESTGGRKAKKLCLRRDAGYGIGIDVALRQVELVVTDLLGEIIAQESLPQPFHDTPDWYQALSVFLTRFLQEKGIAAETVLCAGLSFPGIVDSESQEIVHSHIFGLQHVSLDRFRRAIPFPLVVANDANCACVAESNAAHTTYFYVSLNESVGGALMLNGKLHLGDTWQAGEVGHMLLIPNGRLCYCGKSGCADAYLSPNVLAEDPPSREAFFRNVQSDENGARQKWDIYLEHLAMFLTNLRMLLNVDLIVGGEVGAQIAPFLGQLNAKAAKYDLFARDVDYIYPCNRTNSVFAVGASMLALAQYSGRLLQRDTIEEVRGI